MRYITLQYHDIEQFNGRVTSLSNNPPENHFFQEIQYHPLIQDGDIWHCALIVFGEIPTSD